MSEAIPGKGVIETEFQDRWEAFTAAAREAGYAASEDAPYYKELKKVFSCSAFAASAVARKPGMFMGLVEEGDLFRAYPRGHYDTELEKRVSGTMEVPELGTILREFRLREMVRIAWRDIAGLAELEETVGDLSGLAEACIGQAVSFLHEKNVGKMGRPAFKEGRTGEMVVIGMGKLGAGELNFSSDIDLVFAYPEGGGTAGGRRIYSNDEFYAAVAREFGRLFGEVTADGLLFRVDLRLRPYGDGGPLVMSFDAMEHYYQEQGREWERYAMIKAKVVGGDHVAGAELLSRLSPFVYRRYLDYGVFDAIREMKRSIALEVRKKGLSGNIKIGSGGIREVEFFGQVFQLIRGGVIKGLRERKILKVLKALAQEEMVPETAVKELTEAYVFLRNTEHRLQAYDDRQTHDLPVDPAGQYRLAFSMGFESWETFYETLEAHRERVHGHFDALLTDGEEEAPCPVLSWEDAEETRGFLGEAGFGRPEETAARIGTLFEQTGMRALSPRGRALLSRLLPVLLQRVGKGRNPDLVMGRLMDLLKAIGKRTTYLSLLLEKPGAMTHLVKLAGISPWIIAFLSRHPVLLDELLDPRTLYRPPSREELEKEADLRTEGYSLDEAEYIVEALCVFKQANLLRVAAADVTSSYPLMRVSDRLTDIAEVIIQRVLSLSREGLARRHGLPAGPCGFCVVAYGKLGGIELGYGSDLDLVFLHGGEADVVTTGEKPIGAGEFYIRLGQRMAHTLSVHTPAGMLYETDMRLRPSGISGILVSGMDAFKEYQEKNAWTWEHQALVRARVVAGDPAMAERFGEIRRGILTRQREEGALAAEVAGMREKLRAKRLKHDPAAFDLKEDRGGIVDIEFLVQYITLLKAGDFPELIRWTDNVRLLEGFTDAGILEKRETELLKSAYLAYRAKVHRLSLQNKPAKVEAHIFHDLRVEVIELWERFMGEDS